MKKRIAKVIRYGVALGVAVAITLPAFVSYASAEVLTPEYHPGCPPVLTCRDARGSRWKRKSGNP